MFIGIMCYTSFLKNYATMREPAVSVMAMLLDSHVVNRGSSPRPGGLNSCRVHVRACPRSREENGGEGIAA